jgi:heme O synthase-like polyprenyltransferase
MFTQIAVPIVDLLNQLMGPLLAIVGALGSLYCVVLGVKYAKAEEPQAREQAKEALKNAIVGFALIFILVLALNLLMPSMINWVNTQAGAGILPTPTPTPSPAPAVTPPAA